MENNRKSRYSICLIEMKWRKRQKKMLVADDRDGIIRIKQFACTCTQMPIRTLWFRFDFPLDEHSDRRKIKTIMAEGIPETPLRVYRHWQCVFFIAFETAYRAPPSVLWILRPALSWCIRKIYSPKLVGVTPQRTLDMLRTPRLLASMRRHQTDWVFNAKIRFRNTFFSFFSSNQICTIKFHAHTQANINR